MMRLLLALSLGLLIPSCTADPSCGTPGPEETATERSADPAPIAEAVDAAPPITASCASICDNRYDTCMANAQDATDACLCHNAYVRCMVPCGGHGIIQKCP